MAVHQWKLARAEKQEAYLHYLPVDDPSRTKELDRICQFQLRFERAFQRALRELQKLQKDRRILSEKAASQQAEEQAAEAPPPVDSRPPIPPVYSTTQTDDFGRPAISIPGKLRLRPQFYSDPENPTPEADVQ